ncbi:hypothetical protein Tco_0322695 [Tanacetum coccineum]
MAYNSSSSSSNSEASTYKRGLATVEAQLVTFRKNEVLFSEEIAVLKREVGCKDYEIGVLKTEYEKVKQEKEGIDFKIAKFDKASKDLDKMLESQITDKSKKGIGYHAVVPPHPLSLNAPTKLDLSYSGLEEFQQPEFEGYRLRANKSVYENSSNEPKKYYDAPLIEEWVSDNKDEVESPIVVEKKTVVPTIPKVEVARPKQQEKSVRKTVRYAEMYRQVNTARPKAVVNAVRINQGNLETKLEDSVRLNSLEDKKNTWLKLQFDTDGEVTITATIDDQSKTITEASLRRHLKLEDHDGITSIPNSEIFKQLALIGPKKTAWEQFSSNIATALICLATNRKYNFSRLIFDHMKSKEARKDKGKAIMTEPEPEKKSKKLLEQERLGLEEAIRLQKQVDEEEKAQIARDEEIARQLLALDEERVTTETKTTKDIDWNDPSVQRYYWDMKNKPKSEAQARKNMIVYLKNQSNYKMKDFDGMSYDEIRNRNF